MITLHTLRRALRGLSTTVALACSVLLGGCGPGTGGTGTGDTLWLYSTAQPQDLCGSEWGTALDCTGHSASANSGSARVAYATAEGNLLLVIEGHSARLLRGCPALTFEGRYSRLADGTQRFIGQALADAASSAPTPGPGSGPVLAGLRVQPLAGAPASPGAGGQAPALEIELTDADDRTLLPPSTVQRSTSAQAPSPCR